MTIKPVFHVLAIALFLLTAGTATNVAGEELGQTADIPPGVADARVLIENGKFDEALNATAYSGQNPTETYRYPFSPWSGGDRKIRAIRHH